MKRIGLVAAVLFVGTVWFANWLLARYGVISIGPWRAPAGVLAVGVAFTLRDVVDRTLGKAVVIVCILAGCLLAYLIEANITLGGPTSIAVGSALAFLLSETADLLIYSRIERRSFIGAVAASNTVGAVADSVIFLLLVFGTTHGLLAGQVWGKLLMTAAALPVVMLLAPRLERA